MNSIVLFCGMNWRKQDDPFTHPGLLDFLVVIAAKLPEVHVGAVDWRSLSPGPVVHMFDVRTRTDLAVTSSEVRFAHVYRLGGRPGAGTGTLQTKWSEVERVLNGLENEGIRLVNSGKAIRKGLSKRYLLDLAAAGLPVVPSRFVRSAIPLHQLQAMASDRLSIIKPANGECGRMVHMVHKLTTADLAQMAAHSPELVIQPCMSEILAGEKSLVFLGRHFSHAVRKIPRLPELRANDSSRGATIVPYRPPAAELRLARAAATAFGPELDCFRIDLVGDGAGLRIMELEVVDAGHYCALGPDYAGRLARFYRDLLDPKGTASTA